MIGSGSTWIVCDPLMSRIELTRLQGFDEKALVRHYVESGRTVLLGEAPIPDPTMRWRFRPVTCVEVVKRLLNIDAPAVFTPYQLYRTLIGPTLRYIICTASAETAPLTLDQDHL